MRIFPLLYQKKEGNFIWSTFLSKYPVRKNYEKLSFEMEKCFVILRFDSEQQPWQKQARFSRRSLQMKKIDLHVHTVKTIWDTPFLFDIQKVVEYVEQREIDVLAITNHNVFDANQFSEISDKLKIKVFPGIEINLDGGHLLLISESANLSDFSSKCLEVSSRIVNIDDSISVSTLISIFGDLSPYLLIPHYDKYPDVPEKAVRELNGHVTSGEVTSPKKFIYCLKDESSLVPVYFSDCRMGSDLKIFPTRQSYIHCGETSLGAIKHCLSDKNKVSLSKNDGSTLYQIFEDGQEISTGLTVIIGERSSGKSHTLRKIQEASNKPKHIEQFSLVERDEKKDEERFNKLISQSHSIFSMDYLKEFQIVVQDMLQVDIDDNEKKISDYLESLKKHAKEFERSDSFSKAKLFGEEPYPILEPKGLKELIDSVEHLIENIDFRPIIDKHISLIALKSLIIELMGEYTRRDEEKRKTTWINELVADVRKKLQMQTAATVISEVDFYKISMDLAKRKSFSEIVLAMRKRKELMQKDFLGFKIVAGISGFTSTADLKSMSKSKQSFASAFQFYGEPYQFLQALKEIDGIPDSELHLYFAKISHQILNADGYEVSGGERSEFNLLNEISNAQQYEILLIDEPESSFDNLFLKNDVNKIIKEISQTMPVVLVTHNSTVGASINPDFILHTKKETEGGRAKYRVYSGFPSDRELKSRDGKSLKNFEIVMECLEAGNSAYEERRKLYENLKN